MEQLSIASFLTNGHQFHLFVYSDMKSIPAGTVVRDGAEILPASTIFRYRDSGSYAGFANYFRYEFLLKHGGWWADLDLICLRPFRFADEYVIGSEPISSGGYACDERSAEIASPEFVDEISHTGMPQQES